VGHAACLFVFLNIFQVAGHCGGIARRDYGTGLTLFVFSACGMAHGCGMWILLLFNLF